MADIMTEPGRFFNREQSWLYFNLRVLEEATNYKHPLLERLRFLSISASNLDEFYMVRIAGLYGLVKSGHRELSQEGQTPKEQLKQVVDLANKLVKKQHVIYETLKAEMKSANIMIMDEKDLSIDEIVWLKAYFEDEVFPILTPIAIDPKKPFPFLRNKGFAIGVEFTKLGEDDITHAMIVVPHKINRFVKIPTDDDSDKYISIENVIHLFLHLIFPKFEILAQGLFRIIRDSEIEVDEESEDLVQYFETALKRRRRGSVIRLEVEKKFPKQLRELVIKEYGIKKDQVNKYRGLFSMSELTELIDNHKKDLLFKPYTPRVPKRLKEYNGDFFKLIRKQDLIVHHPYETYDVVIDFLENAVNDPNVVAIKQTLYRTNKNSKIVKALIEAAEAGKNVTALVELKARFDEAANIQWARDLERAGVQVVYGFLHLKTHAKMCLISRKEKEGLKHYMHVATGNYNPITARVYTDLSLFSCQPEIAKDLMEMFNYITGYSKPENLRQISASPNGIFKTFKKNIHQEIENVKNGKPGHIVMKMNSLVDGIIIDELYKASNAGVKIELIVRGICCLRPGVKGLSENITVKSIVGRYLEHSRIYAFGNGDRLPNRDAKLYMASADLMPRNLYRRVEIAIPILDPLVHEQILDEVLGSNIKDCEQSWHILEDGSASRFKCKKSDHFNAHQYFMENLSLSDQQKALKKEANKNQKLTKVKKS